MRKIHERAINQKEKDNGDKPLGIILLILFLVLNLVKSISNLLVRNVSVDTKILSHYDVLGIGIVVSFALLSLNIASLYSLFTRKKWGYKLLIIFFALNILFLIFIYLLSISNLDLVKDFAFQSRTQRGLSTNAIDFATTPIILGIVMILFALFYLVLIYYTHRKKSYFNR